MPFLSLKPRFKISFARPEVVVASILKRAFTPAVLSHCSCSLPCCIQAAPSSMSSRLDIPSHVSLSLSVLSRPLQCILQFEEKSSHGKPDSSQVKYTSDKRPEKRQSQEPDGSATKWKMRTLPQHPNKSHQCVMRVEHLQVSSTLFEMTHGLRMCSVHECTCDQVSGCDKCVRRHKTGSGTKII